MLWLHETHRVRGAHEEEFEAAFREGWMPTLAKDDDARLLYFMHLAHGSGRAYVVTTITAVRDGAAWERIARRVQSGDLRDWARDVDQLRHGVHGKVLFPLPWSDEIASLDLADVPTDGAAEHELTIFMEDTAWPHEGMLEDYLQAAETQYAPSLKEGGRGLLNLQGALQTAWGTGRRSEVVLWQKVLDHGRLADLLAREVPPEFRRPGTWMIDALRVRDDWESRLLRTVRWSPLY
jgi:hypothetical protein